MLKTLCVGDGKDVILHLQRELQNLAYWYFNWHNRSISSQLSGLITLGLVLIWLLRVS